MDNLSPRLKLHILSFLPPNEQVKCRSVSRAFKCQVEEIFSSIQHITVNPEDNVFNTRAPDASILLTGDLITACFQVKRSEFDFAKFISNKWFDPFILFVEKYCPQLVSLSAANATCSLEVIQPLALRLIFFSLHRILSTHILDVEFIISNFPKLKAFYFRLESVSRICYHDLLDGFEIRSPGQLIQYVVGKCHVYKPREIVIPSTIRCIEAKCDPTCNLPQSVFNPVEMIHATDRSMFPVAIPALPNLRYFVVAGGISDLRFFANSLILMPKLEVWCMSLRCVPESGFNFASTDIEPGSLRTLTIVSPQSDEAFISHIYQRQKQHYFSLAIGTHMQNLTLAIENVTFRLPDSTSETLRTLKLRVIRPEKFNFKFANLQACHFEVGLRNAHYCIAWFVDCLRSSTKLENLTIITNYSAVEAVGVRSLLTLLESMTTLRHADISLLKVFDSPPEEARVILTPDVLQKFRCFSWRSPCNWVEFVVPPRITSISVESLTVTLKNKLSTFTFAGCLRGLTFADAALFDPGHCMTLEWVQRSQQCQAEVTDRFRKLTHMQLISMEERSYRELSFIQFFITDCNVKTVRLKLDMAERALLDWKSFFHALRSAVGKPLSLEVHFTGSFPLSEELMCLVSESKGENIISSFIYQPNINNPSDEAENLPWYHALVNKTMRIA